MKYGKDLSDLGVHDKFIRLGALVLLFL
ncbi:hypothetical protein OIU84_000026 [Salix udensis]|uniref:Uncharacterized protein n=1 Tax=Salix udensis TaxID=889485 RepID=A0AAD6L3Y1_9ROSI|nr:hypothetical protein OIU84_000026 [Salix udensis]